jgi:hypothetical protein
MKEIDIDVIVFVCLNTINMTLIWILHLCMMNEDVRFYDGNLRMFRGRTKLHSMCCEEGYKLLK